MHNRGVVRSNLNGLETKKRMKVWTWTHESLDMNTRKVWWTHESLDGNKRKSGRERTKCLVNARTSEHERTKVWSWTHESLDISTFRRGPSGHTYFPLGPQPGYSSLIQLNTTHNAAKTNNCNLIAENWAECSCYPFFSLVKIFADFKCNDLFYSQLIFK